MLQSGAHVGNRDFEEAKRCAKENPLGGQVLGYHFFWKLLVYVWVILGACWDGIT